MASGSYDSKGLKPVSNCNTYNMADIITKDPERIDDVKLLEYQTYVSSHLKKYIKQCGESEGTKFDHNLHLSKLEWLARASKHLSDKLNLTILTHKSSPGAGGAGAGAGGGGSSKGLIPRSSYKFCEYNYDCQFNYKEKYNGCFAQHFVHNLVFADIGAMMQYLQTVRDQGQEINYDELIKCITTIAYVIKHMSEELSNLQFHYGNADEMHVEKSQLKREKRKKTHGQPTRGNQPSRGNQSSRAVSSSGRR